MVFDEAQNIKNPNAQQTIAAKALRGHFRLALTGTPVENHLGDFWCIMDTAEPGPLGAFSEFRDRWITPMNRERARMHEIGRELRDHVGGLMLRRTKEEQLKGLPPKIILPLILCPMSQGQQMLYADAREAVNQIDPEGSEAPQGKHLAALWHLRQISLHPDLVAGGSMSVGRDEQECRENLCRSGKLEWLVKQLDLIRASGEKVLIFCVLKQLQVALARQLEIIYQIPVPIINGDTKVTSKNNPEKTRLSLIEGFSIRPGFGVSVLSPIAAGAGLNIVAANHVIHLERHWNPAKEDQATDRAYRIGQTKPVTVYLPSASHDEVDSFDVVLNRLLEKKKSLQGALGLIPPEPVSAPQLMAEMFGQPSTEREGYSSPLTLDECLKLSWQMFEALIALLYERDADSVILTPHGSDHGADVVVLGWGKKKINILIQCKMTGRDVYDSEEGVRAVSSSSPFFEKPLGVSFETKRLHSTAKKFGRRCSRAGEVCDVDLLGRSWLRNALETQKPTLRELISREGRRRKIS